ncbi:MAG: hypothetical protein ABJE95_32795 [Byssovorax sp.]
MAPEILLRPSLLHFSSRSRRAALAAIALGLAATLHASAARGEPPSELDDAPLARLDRSDERPIDPLGEGPTRAPLWIGIDATMARDHAARPSFGAMLLLGIPLDRGARSAMKSAPSATPEAAELKPAARSSSKLDGPAPASDPQKSSAAEPTPPLRIPIRVTPLVARTAVDAALRQAKLVDPDAHVDAIASRARAAAVLPELRLRASRTADEGQSLSPTSYDPQRTTTTGGTSLWLEARATWRLDRLVFADDEVALERARAQRAEQRQKLVERVLTLLFAWQRALALEDDTHASPEEHLAASLRVIEAEAELDLVTGGWFTAWRARVK